MADKSVLLGKVNKARSGLLIMLFLTVANLAIVVFAKSETVFVFSSALTEVALGFAMGNYYAPLGKLYIIILAAVVLVAVLVLYFLCWLFCKKRTVWLKTSLIVFIIDCVVRVVLLFIAFSHANTPGYDIDLLPTVIGFVFAVWVLYYLIEGVKAAAQLKKLPVEE